MGQSEWLGFAGSMPEDERNQFRQGERDMSPEQIKIVLNRWTEETGQNIAFPPCNAFATATEACAGLCKQLSVTLSMQFKELQERHIDHACEWNQEVNRQSKEIEALQEQIKSLQQRLTRYQAEEDAEQESRERMISYAELAAQCRKGLGS